MAANIQQLIAQRQCVVDSVHDRRLFSHLHAHGSLVERLGYHCQLEGHRGCVNCLQWNATGSLLASGSDDLTAIVWDPHQRKPVAVMPTGHTGNIFSVKFVPFTGDRSLLTGAEDKELKLHDLNSFETTQSWRCNQSRVKRIATCPASPHLCWTAAEDGCVRQFDLREPHSCVTDGGCRNVIIDLKPTCGVAQGTAQCKCLDINPIRNEQIAVGALDAYVRVYDTRILSLKRSSREVSNQADPSCLAHFAPGHISNPRTRRLRKAYNSLACTYVAFSPDGTELLVNLSGDQVYLYDTVCYAEPLRYSFEKQDSISAPRLNREFNSYRNPVLNMRTLTTNPFHERPTLPMPAESVQDGKVSAEVVGLKEVGNLQYEKGNYSVAIDKYNQAILLCPGWHILYSNKATALYARRWDGDVYEALIASERALSLCPAHKKALQRRLRCLHHLGWLDEARRLLRDYHETFPQEKDFYFKYHEELEKATLEAVSRNGFRTESRHLSQWELSRQQTAFDYKARFCGHCNTHTDIKEASFLGLRGEYIAAGSDDGNIFIWEKASGNLVRVLHGDDSIVNCVQWHPTGPMLATSGIESVVRLWEPKARSVVDPEDRVVKDGNMASKENQQRMRVDPFEVMLMRMGFHVAMAQDPAGAQPGEEGRAPEWVREDPSSCRQS